MASEVNSSNSMYIEFTNWYFSDSYNGNWLSAFDVALNIYQVSCDETVSPCNEVAELQL